MSKHSPQPYVLTPNELYAKSLYTGTSKSLGINSVLLTSQMALAVTILEHIYKFPAFINKGNMKVMLGVN